MGLGCKLVSLKTMLLEAPKPVVPASLDRPGIKYLGQVTAASASRFTSSLTVTVVPLERLQLWPLSSILNTDFKSPKGNICRHFSLLQTSIQVEY